MTTVKIIQTPRIVKVTDTIVRTVKVKGSIGGGGASTFLDLTDTPADYSGAAGQILAVTVGEDGVEFIAAPSGSFVGLTDTPGSIAPGLYVRGNVGGTALEFVPVSYNDLTDVPATFPPEAHTHVIAEVTDAATVAATGSYNDLTDVPATFPPEAHTHVVADITDFPALADVATSGSFLDLVDVVATPVADEYTSGQVFATDRGSNPGGFVGTHWRIDELQNENGDIFPTASDAAVYGANESGDLGKVLFGEAAAPLAGLSVGLTGGVEFAALIVEGANVFNCIGFGGVPFCTFSANVFLINAVGTNPSLSFNYGVDCQFQMDEQFDRIQLRGEGDGIQIRNSELRLYNAANDYTAFVKNPSATTSGLVFQIPDDDGSAGDALVTDGSGVLSFQSSAFTTGDMKDHYGTSAPTGWVIADSSTVGSGSSGADYANADAQALFEHLWTVDANLAIFDSSGTPTTRGGSAAADFAADKRLATPDFRARAAVGVSSGGPLSDVALGEEVGSENVSLSVAELPPHNHSISLRSGGGLTGNTDPARSSEMTVTQDATGSTGSGTAHENRGPRTGVLKLLKL